MTYRDAQAITRAIESALVRVEAEQQARAEAIEAALVGAEEALREFMEAIAPLRVRLVHEDVGSTEVTSTDLRGAIAKVVGLRLGEPGKSREVAEFYLDAADTKNPWRLIIRRPRTHGFETFEALLLAVTELADFRSALFDLLASQSSIVTLAVKPLLPPPDTFKFHDEFSRLPSTRPTLVMGAMLGSGFTVLVASIIIAVLR